MKTEYTAPTMEVVVLTSSQKLATNGDWEYNGSKNDSDVEIDLPIKPKF